MAHPDAKLPVDVTVKLPQSVIDAAKRAEAHYAPAQAQAPAPQGDIRTDTSASQTDQPVNIVAVPAAPEQTEPRPLLQQSDQVQPSPQPDPQVTPQPASPDATVGSAEQEHHRFLSMQGRYNQQIGVNGMLQEQLAQMSQELANLTRHVEQQPKRTEPVRKLTPDDEKTYGPEFLDVARRAAQDALGPEMEDLRRQQQDVQQREQRIASQLVLNELDDQLPGWRTINTDPAFLAWLRLPDVYSGGVRGNLLRQAFAAASASRVLAFFKGYIAEAQATGQLPAQQTTAAAPAPTRTAAVPLETLTAPGRIQPAPAQQTSPTETPWFTRAQIREFYSHTGMARYVGREADRKSDEQLIFDAQRLGRVR